MRSLLLAALLLTAPSLRAAAATPPAPAAADWRQSRLTDGMQDALRGAGFRLESDGRVLDPKTHAALTPDQLTAALTGINLNTQRLALERLNLALSKTPPDMDAARALAADLPGDVARAVLANKDLNGLRSLSDANLEKIAAYFDGTRTADDRREAALPVRAGAPGPRVPLPYFDPAEQALGDSLRAAAAKRIGADPFGRKVLARLNGPDGKPDLPPVVVEDLTGAAAVYDYRRRALVVDRQLLLSAIADGVPAKDRGALAQSLASRAALIDYLNKHPEAVAGFASSNDVVLVHELTHAWQDRRDPVMTEMSRGTLPQAMLTDYEIEAWTTKNLYIHSLLKRDPAAAVDDFELQDYKQMVSGHDAWVEQLRQTYQADAVNAMDIATAEEIQRARLAAARRRATNTRDEQTAKAQDLAAMTRAQRELRAVGDAERQRLARLAGTDAPAAAADAPAVLAEHYLAVALASSGPVDFDVAIQKAEAFAVQSGDPKLLAKVRAVKGRKQ
ncbi:MAG: hypothetical protein KGJ84_03230 [Elusimicrobia bacterium]|nr:hypothetical protein [Elusimicrobiota bacterium]